MAHLEEPLDGGLVTSQDPYTLDPGELTAARNGFYAPKDAHIQRAPGWSDYVATAASATSDYVGLAGCYMDHNATNYLVGQLYNGNVVTGALTESTTTVAVAASGSATGATGLVTVPYTNKWFLFNGKENRVMTASGTSVGFRRHGLTPVSNDLGTITTAGSAFAATASGYYEYWYTEVAKYNDGTDVVESTYAAPKASTVYITSVSTQAPVITFPRPVNANETTHYRLYRSSSTKTASADSLYPDGVFIKDIDIPAATATATLATYTDGGTPAQVTGNFGTADSYTYTGWATASGALATGGSEALFTYSSAWGGALDTGLRAGEGWGMMLYAPTTAMSTSITGSIAGVKLDIKMKSSAPEKFQVTCYIGKRTTDTVLGESVHKLAALPARVAYPDGISGPDLTSAGLAKRFGAYPSKTVVMSSISSTYATASLGSQFDDWLPSDYDWTASDFSGDFAVLLVVTPKVRTGTGVPAHGSTITIDGVQLTVYQGGKDAEVGAVYDVITVELGGTAANSGSHGEPPIASCGTVYEGSLVTNNVAKPGLIQYSMPGFPDYFPALYQIQLPFGRGDRAITYIGVVNNRLVVATSSNLYRINYLPNEDDASFSRGRAIETISTGFGCLRPSCATVIMAENGLEELLIANSVGVVGTDGFTCKLVSVDMVWEDFADGIFKSDLPANAQNCIALINSPETQSARLFVRKFDGDDEYGGYWQISYAPQHRKENTGVKWAGPVEVTEGTVRSISCAATVTMADGGHMLLAAHYEDGGGSYLTGLSCKISKEGLFGETTLYNSAGMSLVTRLIPLSGAGNEAQLNGMYVVGRQRTTPNKSPDCTVSVKQYYANRQADTSYSVTTTATNEAVEAYVPLGAVNCNAVLLAVTQDNGTDLALIKLVFVGDGFGEEEAG